MKRITLLTDFGTADGYVAAMKAVIASIAPDVLVDDASHDIAAGDVPGAAWALEGYWQLYPPGTVHVVVVDPGVGSDRRALVCVAAGYTFVAPDNGVLTPVLRAHPDARVIAVAEGGVTRPMVSRTFHGRDLFAPVAAHLAAGMGPETLGDVVADPRLLPESPPVQEQNGSRGVVLHVDRFGNLITNIPGSWVRPQSVVRIGSTQARVVSTYSDVEPGDLLALTGSRGLVEIAVRNGSAAERIWSSRQLEVHVTTPADEAPPPA